MKFVLLAMVVLVATRHSAFADIVISEFLASNGAGIQDFEGDFSDWIEVHNTGNSPVDLGGLSLTDDVTLPNQWTFPSIVLPAGGYQLVFASSKDLVDPSGELHTNFKLSTGGEYLGLIDGATVLDEYDPFPAQTKDVSYGIDSNGDIRFISTPTPGAANGVGIAAAAPATASVDRGFYTNPFTVSLTTAQSGTSQIRYTLDGSKPTATSGSVYNGSPISISTTTILRAATFANGSSPSPTSTYSYVFLDDVIQQPADINGFPFGASRSTGNFAVPLDMAMDPQVVSDYSNEILDSMVAIPTMSMTGSPNTIFGSSGFYFNENEKEVSIEILRADDPSSNEQIDVGVEAHSHNRLKRSLRLNFRSEYGTRQWKTSLIQEGPKNGNSATNKHRTLILRSGNNRSWARDWNPDATAYTEDQFYRDTFIAATGVGSHGTFVHLYL